jgi:hypothetical protein
VVTLDMIDELHQAPDGSASESFRQNREKFVEGEDFFTADSGSYLFTEAGYVKIIQPFDDDHSWRVHREFVNSYVRSRESGNEVQTAQQSSPDRILNNATALRSALFNYTENEATAQLHLKVRELPAVDRNEIDKGLYDADLGRIAAELGQLAAGLEPEEAGVELRLRGEFISAERGLFLNCRERGRVVAGYKAIYGPKRKWSEFCRIVKLPRQTSYDLLAAAEAEDMIDSTESVQSCGKVRRPQVGYDFDTAVDKAEASLNRIFKGMTETQRQQALDALVDRLGVRTGIRLAA